MSLQRRAARLHGIPGQGDPTVTFCRYQYTLLDSTGLLWVAENIIVEQGAQGLPSGLTAGDENWNLPSSFAGALVEPSTISRMVVTWHNLPNDWYWSCHNSDPRQYCKSPYRSTWSSGPVSPPELLFTSPLVSYATGGAPARFFIGVDMRPVTPSGAPRPPIWYVGMTHPGAPPFQYALSPSYAPATAGGLLFLYQRVANLTAVKGWYRAIPSPSARERRVRKSAPGAPSPAESR